MSKVINEVLFEIVGEKLANFTIFKSPPTINATFRTNYTLRIITKIAK